MSGENDELKDRLRGLVRSMHLCYMKQPPRHEMRARLHVQRLDGSVWTYWGDDTPAGVNRVLNDAIREATR